MREIEVIFPSPSGTAPVVNELVQRGFSNEMVVWNIVSCDPKVKYVDIEFEKPKAKFFRSPDGPNTPDSKRLFKKLGPGRRVQIYGHAPNYSSNNPIQDKYTVRGWSRIPPILTNPLPKATKGSKAKASALVKPIAELDPLFVTDKP